MRNKQVLAVVFFSLVVILAVSFGGNQTIPSDISYAQEGNQPVQSAPREALLGATGDNPYIIADIAETASPAIVYLQVEFPVQPQQSTPRYQDPFSDFFDYWFFGPYPRQPRQDIRQGTGFIIDESGIILTNQHVVGDLGQDQTITVTINAPDISGEFEAELVGADAQLDLAVIRLKEDGPFPSVPLGDSDTSRPGEWVIAIGNPYGRQFEHTVTVGVLSAKGREIAIPNRESGTVQEYKNLMQTDAAINRGNSGGPLLNIEGEVIGINTAVHAQAQGIGFAIPINVAKDVLDELIETGGVHREVPPRAWLGVWYQGLTPTLAERLGLTDTNGVIISDIAPSSPASEFGLQPWDVIRRVDDIDIETDSDFAEAIAEKEPGDTVVLTVYRDGSSQFIEVTLGNMPEELRR